MLERPFFSRAISTSSVRPQSVRPRLHEQIQPSLVAQILDPYEVTPDKFEQIMYVLFAHVNKAYGTLFGKFSIRGEVCSCVRSFRERLHELKKGLFSALKVSEVLHSTGPKFELKTGPF